jgi:hypothetical protein
VLERVRAIPGVEDTAITITMPPDRTAFTDSFEIPGKTPAEGGPNVPVPFAGDLPGYLQRLFESQRAARLLAFDEFHHDGVLFEAVDLGDVGMIERGQHLGLPLEARHVIGVLGQRGGQNFEGHVAVESLIAGAVHLAHASLAEGPHDLIRAEFVAWGKWHMRDSA